MKIIQNLSRAYNKGKDAIKKAVSRSSRDNTFGKSIEQKHGSENKEAVNAIKETLTQKATADSPFLIKKPDIAERFKRGQATDKDKTFIESELKLKYNRLDHKFSPAERIQARMEQVIHERFGDDFFTNTKDFIKRIEDNRLGKDDHRLLHAFGLKAHADGSLETIKELPLNPLEKTLCESFDGSLKYTHTIAGIQDPALKYTIRLMRTGLYSQDGLSEQVQEQLKALGLTLKDGTLVKTEQS